MTAQPHSSIQPLYQKGAAAPTKNLNLSRFVYPKPTTAQKTTSLPHKPAPSLPPSLNRSTAVPPLKTNQTDLGLSLSELAKISRCVCCDISWTTRKTGHQKMAHIKSCARKHAFDEETMQILLQTEVQNFVPSKKVVKGKARLVSEEPACKKTFLEDVLVDAAPKKKSKRQQPESLLSNVSQTRLTILARAQEILASSSSNHYDNLRRGLDQNQGSFGQSGIPHGSMIPPSTQEFGQSALARIYSTTSKTLFSAIHSSPPPQYSEDDLWNSDSAPGSSAVRENEWGSSKDIPDPNEDMPSNAYVQ